MISFKLYIDFIPRDLRPSPPTDKYSIFGLSILSLDMTFDASLSPEGSPVNIKIFFIVWR